MNKNSAKYFDVMRYLPKGIEVKSTGLCYDWVDNITCDNPAGAESVSCHDPNDSLLGTIYAPDPVSGYPCSDIAVYLSPSTRPEIRQYIMDNLMMDTSSAAAPKSVDVDDDTLIELTRGTNETIDTYATRVSSYMQRQQDYVKAQEAIQSAAESSKG